MIVLKVLFYLFPVLYILGNIIKLNNTKKYIDFISNINKNLKKSEIENDSDITDELDSKSCLYVTYAISTMIWFIVGLFTYNYEFILIMVGFLTIFNRLTYKSKAGATFGNVLSVKFGSFINIIFYLFLIINTFHLHLQLDLFNYIKNLY